MHLSLQLLDLFFTALGLLCGVSKSLLSFEVLFLIALHNQIDLLKFLLKFYLLCKREFFLYHTGCVLFLGLRLCLELV